MSAVEQAEFGRNLRRHLFDGDMPGPSGLPPSLPASALAARSRLSSETSSYTSMGSESGTPAAAAVVQHPPRRRQQHVVVHRASVEALPTVQVNAATREGSDGVSVADNHHEEV